jgi:hypothetical protein
MNEFHQKIVEKEAREIAGGMRRAGLIVSREQMSEILLDLTQIAKEEMDSGRSPTGWLITRSDEIDFDG